MTENGYDALSGVYDILNNEIDYGEWANFIADTIKKYEKTETKLVLDLGCGTGKMTFALRNLGYDMTGIDISPEMLDRAHSICEKEGIEDILWLCQDMTEFELYGTVDAAVCCLDGINHLTETDDVAKCFDLVHNYLIPDGIFIFDLNTPHKFENVYGQNDYILEDEGILLTWQNDYNGEEKINDFYFSLFTEDSDGRYSRTDSDECERCYTEEEIKTLLENSGFELLYISGGYNYVLPEDSCDRWYIAARCIKK